MAATGVTVLSHLKSGKHKATDPTFRALNWLLIISIVVAIIPQGISNVFGWDERELFDQRQWIFSWYYPICIVIGIVTSVRYWISRLATDRYDIFLITGVFFFLFSVLFAVLGGGKISPMCIMAPFFTVLIFHVFPRTNTDINLFIVRGVLIVFSLVPWLGLFFPHLFDFPFELYMVDSFRGFSSSRTDYGYLVGIGILMLVVRPASARWIFLLAMFFVLLLSESRAALVSVIVSSAYLLMASGYRRSRVLLGLVPLVVGSYLVVAYFGSEYSRREISSLFEDTGQRVAILEASLEKASHSILFGSGAFYQSVDAWIGYTVEAHNSILQSVLNFGIFATFSWYAMLGKTYFSFNPTGRSFLLYWLIFGLFQPGFDAFLFTPEGFIPLLLAIHFGSCEAKSAEHSKTWSRVRLTFPRALQISR